MLVAVILNAVFLLQEIVTPVHLLDAVALYHCQQQLFEDLIRINNLLV